MNISHSFINGPAHFMQVDGVLDAIFPSLQSSDGVKRVLLSGSFGALSSAQKRHVVKYIESCDFTQQVVVAIVRNNDMDLLLALFEAGLDLNLELEDEMRLLDFAETKEMIAFLAQHGARCDYKDSKHRSIMDRLWNRYLAGDRQKYEPLLAAMICNYKGAIFRKFGDSRHFLENINATLIDVCIEAGLLLERRCTLALRLIDAKDDNKIFDILGNSLWRDRCFDNEGYGLLLFILVNSREAPNERRRLIVGELLRYWKKDEVAEKVFAEESDPFKALSIWAFLQAPSQNKLPAGDVRRAPKLAPVVHRWEPSCAKPPLQPIPVALLEKPELARQIDQLLNGPHTIDEGLSLLEELPAKEVPFLFHYFFSNPGALERLSERYFVETEIVIGRDKPIRNSWSPVALRLLQKLSAQHLQKVNRELVRAYSEKVTPTPVAEFRLTGKIVKKLGRTILVQPPGEGRKLHAFKVKKAGELAFSREMAVTKLFKKCSQEFKSGFHTPCGVYSTLMPLHPEMATDTKEGDLNIIYHYEADPEYFLYPQELADEDFERASNTWAHDGAKQVRNGIYHENVGLFHDRDDERRLMLFIDILFDRKSVHETTGAGRAYYYRNHLLHPNVRGNGVADLIDAQLLERALVAPSKVIDGFFLTPFLQESTNEENRPFRSLVLQMIGLSRHLLAPILLVADRKYRQDLLDWNDKEQCRQMGEGLRERLVSLLMGYTGREKAACNTFASHCKVDWERMARQISFWADHKKGFGEWVARGQLPSGLYPEWVPLSLIIEELEDNFDLKDEGHIGVHSGSLCLPEFEKASMLFALFCLGLAEYDHLT